MRGLKRACVGGRGQGTARHGRARHVTARHGTARHGAVDWCRAGGRERFVDVLHGLDRLDHRLELLCRRRH
eukprot:1324106-Prymnesium_polylepis.1